MPVDFSVYSVHYTQYSVRRTQYRVRRIKEERAVMMSEAHRASRSPATRMSPQARRRPWMLVPLVVITIGFVGFALFPYVTLDPGRSRIPVPSGAAAYYPALVAHVVFGSVAMLTCAVQLWPWLRRRYPAVHRVIGRVYVFGGVLPAGVLGFAIGVVSPFGPVIRVSNVLLAVLWVTVTLAGFRKARQRRLVEHRRWMIRSFVLTLSVISNRMWAAVWFLVLSPQLATTFAGSEALMVQTIAGLSGWMGWVIPLVIAEGWLERDALGSERREVDGERLAASNRARAVAIAE
jgi:uncharacterized membrane protein